MGGVIGGIIGGIGSLIGANKQAKAANQAAQSSLTGYNYLVQNPYAKDLISQGQQAGQLRNDILGIGDNPAAGQQALDNYFASPGFQFQKQQGMSAITGSQAASGLLNSGGTLKALENYGQNLAATGRDNYLGQLSSVAGQGQQVLGQTAAAGGSGGANAAGYINSQGQIQAQGLGNALGAFGGAVNSMPVGTQSYGGTSYPVYAGQAVDNWLGRMGGGYGGG